MSMIWRPGYTWNETIWNPSMISTALWLDAADASTVTTVSGAVSEWRDKSGNARHVIQTNSANRPAYTSNAVNGNPVADFDGIDDFMVNTGAQLQRNLAVSTIFAVTKLDVNSAGSKVIVFVPTSTGSSRTALAYNNGLTSGFHAGGRRTSTDSFQQQSVSPYSGNVTIDSVVFNYSNANILLYENGLNTVSAAFQSPGLTDNDAGDLFVGSVSNGTQGWNGYICEILFADAALSTATRQRIEGYLAHKWGLNANLPAGHPYKIYGPTP